jgi:hypothetical protein
LWLEAADPGLPLFTEVGGELSAEPGILLAWPATPAKGDEIPGVVEFADRPDHPDRSGASIRAGA